MHGENLKLNLTTIKITLLLLLVPAVTDYMWFLSSELYASNSATDTIQS